MTEKIEKYCIYTHYDEKAFATEICHMMKRIVVIHQLCTEKPVDLHLLQLMINKNFLLSYKGKHVFYIQVMRLFLKLNSQAYTHFDCSFSAQFLSAWYNHNITIVTQKEKALRLKAMLLHKAINWKQSSFFTLITIITIWSQRWSHLIYGLSLILMILVISWSFVQLHMLNSSSVMAEMFICLEIFSVWLLSVFLIVVSYDEFIRSFQEWQSNIILSYRMIALILKNSICTFASSDIHQKFSIFLFCDESGLVYFSVLWQLSHVTHVLVWSRRLMWRRVVVFGWDVTMRKFFGISGYWKVYVW